MIYFGKISNSTKSLKYLQKGFARKKRLYIFAVGFEASFFKARIDK